MPGGMPASAQLLGYLAGGQFQPWAQGVEHTAFSHARIAGKGGELAGKEAPQLGNALPGLGTGPDYRKACPGINPLQIHRRVQIAFIDADINLYPLVAGNGRYPVNEEGLRHGIYIGSKHHQGVHIGNRRTDEAVFPGENPLHHAFAAFYGDFHHVAGKGTLAAPAQASPAPAGDHTCRGLHFIKTAEGADNTPGSSFTHGLKTTSTEL